MSVKPYAFLVVERGEFLKPSLVSSRTVHAAECGLTSQPYKVKRLFTEGLHWLQVPEMCSCQLEELYIRRISTLAKLKDQKLFNSFPCFSCAAEKRLNSIWCSLLWQSYTLDSQTVCSGFPDLSFAWICSVLILYGVSNFFPFDYNWFSVDWKK